jgi:hypothetical protein
MIAGQYQHIPVMAKNQVRIPDSAGYGRSGILCQGFRDKDKVLSIISIELGAGFNDMGYMALPRNDNDLSIPCFIDQRKGAFQGLIKKSAFPGTFLRTRTRSRNGKKLFRPF